MLMQHEELKKMLYSDAAWRRADGIMWDRKLTEETAKRKSVGSLRFTSLTLSPTETQKEKTLVAENI